MIKKFEEYIAEGMWKSGLNRAKNNTIRKEDIPNNNIKHLIPIDLEIPFYFADSDLSIDDEVIDLTSEEKDKWVKIAKEYGWRLPRYSEIDRNLLENFQVGRLKDKFECTYESLGFRQGGQCILELRDNDNQTGPHCAFHMNTDDKFPIVYWLEDGEMEVIPLIGDICGIRTMDSQSSTPKRIKFIKDKK